MRPFCPIHHRPRRPAFTLVELVVVIVVLAILGGVAIPTLFNTSDKAREATAAGNRATLAAALNQFRLDRAASGSAAWPATLDLVLDTRQGEQFFNPYRLPNQPVYLPEPGNSATKWHVQIKTVEQRMTSQYKGCIWYNNVNGAMRFCVARQANNAQTIALYNRVNGSNVTSINQTGP